MDTNALTSGFTYALHLDEQTYSPYLQDRAVRSGVERVVGNLADVERGTDGRVTSLVLATGERLRADYFLDCSGPDARLMDRLDREREDWSQWLPNDRVITAVTPADESLCALTTTRAMAEGWCWRMPLQQHSLTGVVFDSARLGASAAESQLQRWSGENLADVRLAKLQAGRRRRCWVDNCIAMGSAAASIEPLASSPLHLLQLGISTFIEFFPLDAHSRVEATEYNRVLAQHIDSLRDFTLAHYLVSRRSQAPRTSSEPALERLFQRLELFKSNGRVTTADHETFEELDWAWALLGSEYWPDSMEIHARSSLDEALRPDTFDSMKNAIERLVSTMPLHRDYLQHLQ
jgi:tryptophan halogenase